MKFHHESSSGDDYSDADPVPSQQEKPQLPPRKDQDSDYSDEFN